MISFDLPTNFIDDSKALLKRTKAKLKRTKAKLKRVSAF
jgi:hypothetical protein